MGLRTLAFTKQMFRVFNLVELEELDHLVANAWSLIPRSSKTDRDLIATRSEDEQAQANKHIHMHKNITLYKIKCYKSKQYRIESASTVTREYETHRSELRSISYRVYAKRIWTMTFNSPLSNINYNYYLIKTRFWARQIYDEWNNTTACDWRADTRNSARDERERARISTRPRAHHTRTMRRQHVHDARSSIPPCAEQHPRLSHPVLEGKPNANHVRARISYSRTQQLHNMDIITQCSK
jgi:hypothetical protein